MKRFLRRVSPKRAVVDFAQQWQQPTPHRWPILGVALAMTFALFMLFIPASQRIVPQRPEVIYISTFADDRSEAEIIASNCENQRFRNELEARLEERAELRRDIYKALGRATFIDVDEIEQAAADEQAAAEAEADALRAEAGFDESLASLSLEEYCARAAG